MTEQKIPGFPARRAALRMLDAVLRLGKPLEQAMDAALKDVAPGPDRALARAIASETLRWLPDLDALIDGATRQRLPDDAKARMVLRLALAQALVMGTPPHAAISTALPLVDGGPRRLVHGVLGSLFRGNAALPASPSLPDPVLMRWQAAWGADMVGSASAALVEPASLDLSLKNLSQTASFVEQLEGQTLLPGHVRIGAEVDVTALPGYKDGAWWVQNLSASLPALILGEGNGKTVLDLCAAPGGKTMQLASNGWKVTALDGNQRRMETLRENLARTKLDAKCITADALKWQPNDQFDAILLDAPCSATGIFARHPDVLHRVRPNDIKHLAQIQRKMLARAAQWLKPGGTLVYSTCSLEPEEGEAIDIPSELKRAPINQGVLPNGLKPNPDGSLRIFPNHNMQGFFILLCTTS